MKSIYTLFFILFVNLIATVSCQEQATQTHELDSPQQTISSFKPQFINEQEPFFHDNKSEIIIGQSGMFSGHFMHYAHAIRNGINALFHHLNQRGGIHGKKMRLVSMEDFGNPSIAKNNVLYLLNQHHVTLFMGNMGTRSLVNLLPLLKQESIGLLFPWGSDLKLQNPNLHTIVNGPGLLEPQLKALVSYAKQNLKINKVAIFHADDSFSEQATQQLINLLKEDGINAVARTEYNRFTMDIMPAARKLIDADPKLVFCIATSIPTVKLINHFFDEGHFGTIFLGIDSTSFVSHIVAPKGVSFYSSSSVPSPQVDIPLAAHYRQQLEALIHDPAFNTLSFSYYLAATILVQALKKASDINSPRAVVKEIEAMKKTNIDGFTVSFNEKNRHIFGESAYIIHD